MHLLFAVINNEDLLDELITGWMDLGITGGTVLESTDALQLLSSHVPIFAGFRSLTAGGVTHNKTLFTAIKSKALMEQAVAFLEDLFERAGAPHQGVWFVLPMEGFGFLGSKVDDEKRRRHAEKKMGKTRPEKRSGR
ncbi:MAG: hypothetical protein AB1921_01590 [Thermodesulfobacteriota bacterium]